MKNFLNALIFLFALWFLLISETHDVTLIANSMVCFTFLTLARINYRSVIQFFQEKET